MAFMPLFGVFQTNTTITSATDNRRTARACWHFGPQAIFPQLAPIIRGMWRLATRAHGISRI